MRNKILMFGVLVMVFVIAGNIRAANQKSNGEEGNQAKEQIQTENQGGSNQIKTQDNEQTQDGGTTNQTDSDVATQTQQQAQQESHQQTQQKSRDGNESEEGNQIQNQNQIKNQGETNQIQNSEQEVSQSQNKSGSAIAQQRRSQVANAVQEMLRLADRNGGIGQQVRIIAQNQTQNQEKLEANLEKVQSRSRFAKFFVGPNYGEINKAKKILEQNREQIMQLNQIKDQLIDQGDGQTLNEQIQTLEQANSEIENSLGTARKGFSLFGWIFRLFAK